MFLYVFTCKKYRYVVQARDNAIAAQAFKGFLEIHPGLPDFDEWAYCLLSRVAGNIFAYHI